MNPTMQKFGYPESLIKEFDHWVVLLRPQQTTLGALVLICKDQAEALSRISAGAFAELKLITSTLESALTSCFAYDKLNYLMLMMVDRDVHFHVLPRYAAPRSHGEMQFRDPGWPGPPDLSHVNKTDEKLNRELQRALQAAVSARPG